MDLFFCLIGVDGMVTMVLLERSEEMHVPERVRAVANGREPAEAVLVERTEAVVCSAQVWDLDLGGCAECLTQPGRVHSGVRVKRTVEVLGFHFQVFKMHWRRLSRRDALADYVPPRCGRNASGPFELDLQGGFRCAAA